MIEGTVRKTAYASAARTATPTAYEFSMEGRRALHCVIDVTAVTDTPSVTPTIAALDPLSGKYYTLLAGAAITATGTTVLKIGPGIAASANAAAADIIPDGVKLTMTHGDADSITYSVAFHLVP
jgi:hypothetical protein